MRRPNDQRGAGRAHLGRALMLATVVAGLAAWILSLRNGSSGRLSWLLFSISILILLGVILSSLLRRGDSPDARVARGLMDFVNSSVGIVSGLLSIISAILAIVVAHIALTSVPTRHGDSCAVALGGPARLAALSESDELNVNLDFPGVHYSLYSADSNPASAQLHSAMYGHLTGEIPTGHAIYVLLKYIHSTTSDEGVSGYPHYYPRGRILPDDHGCWKLQSRNLGEPGTVGIKARLFFMLVPDSSAATFENQKKYADESSTNNTGFTGQEISRLGASPLEYFDINTSIYDVVSRFSSA
jgi:hypothetical protein